MVEHLVRVPRVARHIGQEGRNAHPVIGRKAITNRQRELGAMLRTRRKRASRHADGQKRGDVGLCVRVPNCHVGSSQWWPCARRSLRLVKDDDLVRWSPALFEGPKDRSRWLSRPTMQRALNQTFEPNEIDSLPLLDRKRVLGGFELDGRSLSKRTRVDVRLQIEGVGISGHAGVEPAEVWRLALAAFRVPARSSARTILSRARPTHPTPAALCSRVPESRGSRERRSASRR